MNERTSVAHGTLRQDWWFAFQSVRMLDNWPQALAAFCDDVRGRAPESALVLRFVDGLELEMMPGGIGAYTSLFPEIFCDRVYEPPEFTFGDAPVILDLGANIGFFSCKMAKQFPKGRIVAVEVMPQYCELMRNNLRRNRLQNVTVIEGAIGDGRANAEIRYWFTEDGYLKVTSVVPADANVEVLSVASTSLARLLKDNDIDACDLLKVDIEGHEHAMFSTISADDLRRCRQIALEWHGSGSGAGARQIATAIENAGFDILPKTTLDGEMGMLYALRVNG
jgi:FkbM family methyltransferase